MQSSPRIEELRQKFHENPRRYFAPLANEYRKAGDPEQAIAICRAHLAQQPAHMSGHVVYGQALYDAHRIDEAREVFQLALALDPENIIVLRHLGDIARQRGDVAEARSWYSRALDGDPHDAEVAAYLAELTEPLVSHGVESEAPAPVALADEAVSEASADAPPDLDESPYLETEQATAATSPEAPPEAAPQLAERQSRLTPTGEGFPILTRTLAELYLQQGHIEAALDIYRQLAEHEPEDADIRTRIAALSLDARVPDVSEPQVAVASQQETESMEGTAGDVEMAREEDTDTEREEDTDAEPEAEPEHILAGAAVDEQVLEEELKEAADFTGGDDLQIAEITDGIDEVAETTPDDELSETTDDELADATVDEALAATTPDDKLAEATVDEELAALTPESELTLTDISWPEFGTNDLTASTFESVERAARESESSDRLWDTADFLGGGFFEDTEAEDEIFGLADDALSVASRAEKPAPPPEPELAGSAPESEAEDLATAAQSDEMAAEGDPSELVSDESPYASSEVVAVEAATPALTVREFFATLGSIRPPFANETEDAYAGADAEPAYPAPWPEEAVATQDAYPAAADAFANLFADSPINAEDSRAAAALSSAVAHGAPFSTPSTPSGSRRPSPSPPREMTAQPGQESEEDIRRFREWLDGLAES